MYLMTSNRAPKSRTVLAALNGTMSSPGVVLNLSRKALSHSAYPKKKRNGVALFCIRGRWKTLSQFFFVELVNQLFNQFHHLVRVIFVFLDLSR